MQASMSEVVLPLDGRDDEEVHQTENDDLSVPLDPSGYNYGHSSNHGGKDKDDDIIDRTLGLIFGDDFAHNPHHSIHTNVGFVRDEIIPVDQEALKSAEPKNHDYSTEPYPTWDEGESEFNNYFQSYAQKQNASGTISPPVNEKGLSDRLASHEYSLDVLPVSVQEKLVQGYTFEESLNPLTSTSNGNSLQEGYFDEISEDLKDCKSFYESQSSEISSEGSSEDVSPSCSIHTVPLSDGMMDVVTSSPTEEYGSPVGMDAGVGKNVVIEMSQVSSPDVARVPTSDNNICQPMSPPSYQQSVSYLSTECCGPHGAIVANKIVLPYSGDGILSENDSNDYLDEGPPELDPPIDDRQNVVIDQPNEFPPVLTSVNTTIISTSKVIVQAIPSAAGEDLTTEVSSPDELNVSLGKIVPSITTDISNQIPTGYIMNDVYSIRNITPDTSLISVGPDGSGTHPVLLPSASKPKSYLTVNKSSRNKKSQFSSDIRALTRFDTKEAELRRRARQLLESNPDKLNGHEKVSVKIALKNFPTCQIPSSFLVQGLKVGEPSNAQAISAEDVTKQCQRVPLHRPLLFIKDRNGILQPTVRKLLAVKKPVEITETPPLVAVNETNTMPVPSNQSAFESKDPLLKEPTTTKPNIISNQSLKVSLPLNLLDVKPLASTKSEKIIETPDKERAVENREVIGLDQEGILSLPEVSVPFLLPVNKSEVSPSKSKVKVVEKLKKVTETRPAPVAVKISNKDIKVDRLKRLTSEGVTMTVRAVKSFLTRDTELSAHKISTNDVNEPKEGITPVNDKCQEAPLNGREASTANDVSIPPVLPCSLVSKAVDFSAPMELNAVPKSSSKSAIDSLKNLSATSQNISKNHEPSQKCLFSHNATEINPLSGDCKVNNFGFSITMLGSQVDDVSGHEASKVREEPSISHSTNTCDLELPPLDNEQTTDGSNLGDLPNTCTDPNKHEGKSVFSDILSGIPSQSCDLSNGDSLNEEVKIPPVLEQIVIEMIESSRSPQVVVEQDKLELDEQPYHQDATQNDGLPQMIVEKDKHELDKQPAEVATFNNGERVPKENIATEELQNFTLISTNLLTDTRPKPPEAGVPCDEVIISPISEIFEQIVDSKAIENNLLQQLENKKADSSVPEVELIVANTYADNDKSTNAIKREISQFNIEPIISEADNGDVNKPHTNNSLPVTTEGESPVLVEITQPVKDLSKSMKDNRKKKREMLTTVVTERTSKIMQNANPENKKLGGVTLKSVQLIENILGDEAKNGNLSVSQPPPEVAKRPRTRSETKLLDPVQTDKSDPTSCKPESVAESFPLEGEEDFLSKVNPSVIETKDMISSEASTSDVASSLKGPNKPNNESTPKIAAPNPRVRGKIERKPATVKTIPATPMKGGFNSGGNKEEEDAGVKKEIISGTETCIAKSSLDTPLEDEGTSVSTGARTGRNKISSAPGSVTKRPNSFNATDSKLEVEDAVVLNDVKTALGQRKIKNPRATKTCKGVDRTKLMKMIRLKSVDKMSSNDVYDFTDDEEDQTVKLHTIDHYRKASGKGTNKRSSTYKSHIDKVSCQLDNSKNCTTVRMTRSESSKTLNVRGNQSASSHSLLQAQGGVEVEDNTLEHQESTKVSSNAPVKLSKKMRKSTVRKPSVWTVKRATADGQIAQKANEECVPQNKTINHAREENDKCSEKTETRELPGRSDDNSCVPQRPAKIMLNEISTSPRSVRSTRRSMGKETATHFLQNDNEMVATHNLPREPPTKALQGFEDTPESAGTAQKAKSKGIIAHDQILQKNGVVSPENLPEENKAVIIDDISNQMRSIRNTRRSKSTDASSCEHNGDLNKNGGAVEASLEKSSPCLTNKSEDISIDRRPVRSTRRPMSKETIAVEQTIDHKRQGVVPPNNQPEERKARASRRSMSKESEVDDETKQENGLMISTPTVSLRSSRRSKSGEDMASFPEPLVSASMSNENSIHNKLRSDSMPQQLRSKGIDASEKDKNGKSTIMTNTPVVVALRISERVKTKEGNALPVRPNDVSVKLRSKDGNEPSLRMLDQSTFSEACHSPTAPIKNKARSKSKEFIPCKKPDLQTCAEDPHQVRIKNHDCPVSLRKIKSTMLDASLIDEHNNECKENNKLSSSDERTLRVSQRLKGKDGGIIQRTDLIESEKNSNVLAKFSKNKGSPEKTNPPVSDVLPSEIQSPPKLNENNDVEVSSMDKVNDTKLENESTDNAASSNSTRNAANNELCSALPNKTTAEAINIKDPPDGTVTKRIMTRSSLDTLQVPPKGRSKDTTLAHSPTKETRCNKSSPKSEDAPLCPKLRSSGVKKFTENNTSVISNKSESSRPLLSENFMDKIEFERADTVDSHRVLKKARKVDLTPLLKDSVQASRNDVGATAKEVLSGSNNMTEPLVEKIKNTKRNVLLLPQESPPCNAEPVSLKTPLMDSASSQELEPIQTVAEMTQHGEPEGASSSTRFAQLQSLLPPNDVDVRNPVLHRKKHKKLRQVDQKDVSGDIANHLSQDFVQKSKQERLHSILDPLRNAKSQKLAEETSCKGTIKTKNGDGPSKVSRENPVKLGSTALNPHFSEESINRRITRSSGSSQNLVLDSKLPQLSEDVIVVNGLKSRRDLEGALKTSQVVHPKKGAQCLSSLLSNSVVSRNQNEMTMISPNGDTCVNLGSKENVSQDTVKMSFETNEVSQEQSSEKIEKEEPSDKSSNNVEAVIVSECTEISRQACPIKYPTEEENSLTAVHKDPKPYLTTTVVLDSQTWPNPVEPKTRPSAGKPKTSSETDDPQTFSCPTPRDRRVVTPTKVVCEFSTEAQKLFEEVSQEDPVFDAIVQSPGKSPDSTTQSTVDVIPDLTKDSPTIKIAEEWRDGVTSTTEFGMSCVQNCDIVVKPQCAKKHKYGSAMLIRKEDEGVSSTTIDSKALEIPRFIADEPDSIMTPIQTPSNQLTRDELLKEEKKTTSSVIPPKDMSSADGKQCDSQNSIPEAKINLGNSSSVYGVWTPQTQIWNNKSQILPPDEDRLKAILPPSEKSSNIKQEISEEELKKRTPLKKRQVRTVVIEEATCLKSSIDVSREDVCKSDSCSDGNPPTSLVDQLSHSICNILAVNSVDKINVDCCSSEDKGPPTEKVIKKDKSSRLKVRKRNQKMNKKKRTLRFKNRLNKRNKIGVTIMQSTTQCRSNTKSKVAKKIKVSAEFSKKMGSKKPSPMLNHTLCSPPKVIDLSKIEPISLENSSVGTDSISAKGALDRSGNIACLPTQLDNAPTQSLQTNTKSPQPVCEGEALHSILINSNILAPGASSCSSEDPASKSANLTSTQLTVDTSYEINEDPPPFSPHLGCSGVTQQHTNDWRKTSEPTTVEMSVLPNIIADSVGIAPSTSGLESVIVPSSSYSLYPKFPVLEQQQSFSILDKNKIHYHNSGPKLRKKSYSASAVHSRPTIDLTTPIDLSNQKLRWYKSQISEKKDPLDFGQTLSSFMSASGVRVTYNVLSENQSFEAPHGSSSYVPPMKPPRSNIPIWPIPTRSLSSATMAYPLPGDLPVEVVPPEKSNFDLYMAMNNNYPPSAFCTVKNKMGSVSSITHHLSKSNPVHRDPLLYHTPPASNFLMNAAGCSSLFSPKPSTSRCGTLVPAVRQKRKNRYHKVRNDLLPNVITSSKVTNDVGHSHEVPQTCDVKLHKAQVQLRKRNPELSITRATKLPQKTVTKNRMEVATQELQSTSSSSSTLTREIINFIYKTEGKALEPLDVVICELNEAKYESNKPRDKSKKDTGDSQNVNSILDKSEVSYKPNNGVGCPIAEEVTLSACSVGSIPSVDKVFQVKKSIPITVEVKDDEKWSKVSLLDSAMPQKNPLEEGQTEGASVREALDLCSNMASDKQSIVEMCVKSPAPNSECNEMVSTCSNEDPTFQVPGSNDKTAGLSASVLPTEEVNTVEEPSSGKNNTAGTSNNADDELLDDNGKTARHSTSVLPIKEDNTVEDPSTDKNDTTGTSNNAELAPCPDKIVVDALCTDYQETSPSYCEKELPPPLVVGDNPSSLVERSGVLVPLHNLSSLDNPSCLIPPINEVPSESACNVPRVIEMDLSEGIEQTVIVEEPSEIIIQLNETEELLIKEPNPVLENLINEADVVKEVVVVKFDSGTPKEGSHSAGEIIDSQSELTLCDETAAHPSLLGSELHQTSFDKKSSKQTESLKVVPCVETGLDDALIENVLVRDSSTPNESDQKEAEFSIPSTSENGINIAEMPKVDPEVLLIEKSNSITPKTDLDVPISQVPYTIESVDNETNTAGIEVLEIPAECSKSTDEVSDTLSTQQNPDVGQSADQIKDILDAPEMIPMSPQVVNGNLEPAAPEITTNEVDQLNQGEDSPAPLGIGVGAVLPLPQEEVKSAQAGELEDPAEFTTPAELVASSHLDEPKCEQPSSILVDHKPIENIPEVVTSLPKECTEETIKVVKSHPLAVGKVEVTSVTVPLTLDENQRDSFASEATTIIEANVTSQANVKETIVELAVKLDVAKNPNREEIFRSEVTLPCEAMLSPSFEVTAINNCDGIQGKTNVNKTVLPSTADRDSAGKISSSNGLTSTSDIDVQNPTEDTTEVQLVQTVQSLCAEPGVSSTASGNSAIKSLRSDRKRKHSLSSCEGGEVNEKMSKVIPTVVEHLDVFESIEEDKDRTKVLPKVIVDRLTQSILQKIQRSGVKICKTDLKLLGQTWKNLDKVKTISQEITIQSARISDSKLPGGSKENVHRPSTSKDSYYKDAAESESQTVLESGKNQRRTVTPNSVTSEKNKNERMSLSLDSGKKGQKRPVKDAFGQKVVFYKDHREATSVYPRPPATVRELKFRMVPIRSYSWILKHLREIRKNEVTDETVVAPNMKDFIRPLPEPQASLGSSDCALGNASQSRLGFDHDMYIPSHAPPSPSRIPTFVISSDSEDSNAGGVEDCTNERDEVRRRIRRKSGTPLVSACSCPLSGPTSSRNACPTCRKERYHSQGGYSPARTTRPPFYTKVDHRDCHEPERVMKCAATVGGSEEAVVLPNHDPDLQLIKALVAMKRTTPSTASPSSGTWIMDFDALKSDDAPASGSDPTIGCLDETTSLPSVMMSLGSPVLSGSSRSPEVSPISGAAFRPCLQGKPILGSDSPGQTMDTTGLVQLSHTVTTRPSSSSASQRTSETSLRQFRAALSSALDKQSISLGAIGSPSGSTGSPRRTVLQRVASTSTQSDSPSHPTTPAEYMPLLKRICAELPSKETNELVQYLLQGPPSKKRKS